MEPVVVDAEVVPYFVQDGDANLLANVIVVIANGLDIALVDANSVGQDEVVVLAAFGEGDAVIEAKEEMALVKVSVVEVVGRGRVFDDEVDIVDLAAEGLGYLIEGFADQAAEV